jgi:hypothetical protein
MQLDVEFEKEQIGTTFVRVGQVAGPLGGWVVGQRAPTEKLRLGSFRIVLGPPGQTNK